jgi:Tfp pilus assembly protein PilF
MRSIPVLLLLFAGCAHAAAAGSTPERAEQPRRPLAVDLAERGKQLAAAGEDVRAEQYLAGALEAGGDVAAILPALLRVCVSAERYEAALAYAERYQPSGGENVQLDLVLAALQLGLGQVERARRNLELVLAQQDEPQAHYLLGQLYYHSLQDYGEADRHYRQYLALAPDGRHAAEAQRSLLKPTASTNASTPRAGKHRPREVRP